MDGGFFSVVAARTIGALPRLRPVIASRFETAADLAPDVLELDQEWAAAPDVVEIEQKSAAAPRPAEQQLTLPQVRAPMLSAAIEEDAPLLPTETQLAVAPLPTRIQVEERLRLAALIEAPEAQERQTEVSRPTTHPPRALSVRRAPAPRPGDIRYRPVDAAAPQSHDAARETSLPEPAGVTVRIGRIDVRAILAPPAPAATPAPVKRAGPSLEEHLRRRDAELR